MLSLQIKCIGSSSACRKFTPAHLWSRDGDHIPWETFTSQIAGQNHYLGRPGVDKVTVALGQPKSPCIWSSSISSIRIRFQLVAHLHTNTKVYNDCPSLLLGCAVPEHLYAKICRPASVTAIADIDSSRAGLGWSRMVTGRCLCIGDRGRYTVGVLYYICQRRSARK